MARMSRRGMLVGLGLAATGLGCGGMNPFLLPYHVQRRAVEDPRRVPAHPAQDKKNEAKVVVFVSSQDGHAAGPGRAWTGCSTPK